MNLTLIVLIAVAGGALFVWLLGIRVINEYERGVVFRLGRLSHMKSPGLRMVIPLIDRVVKVDLRTIDLEVPALEVLTQDHVAVTVSAVVYLQVVNPPLAVIKVANYRAATMQLVQSTLRSVLGQVLLNDLLSERERVNEAIGRVLDDETEPWGVKVSMLEIKDAQLPETMLRALGREAEAERETRAKLISAEGELAAARALTDAALVIAAAPNALQLRYLQTLREIGGEQNTVIVFPMPIDLVQPIIDAQGRSRRPGQPSAEPARGPDRFDPPPPPPP